ncbi:MAG: hypothetical protein ACOVOV_19635 [Dolichospermum sp.]
MKVAEINTTELNLDPKRFQYKLVHNSTGATGSLSGIDSWNVYLSGIVLVWEDPMDSKIYIVNGHNRVTLAKKLGTVEKILCRFIDAQNHIEARLTGALANIAEGQGTAIDAAKFFRDSSYTVNQVKNFGINPRLKIVQDGLSLSNLVSFLFDKVITGTIPIDKGVVLGSVGTREQLEVWELIKNKQVSTATLDEIIANVLNPVTGQMSLLNLYIDSDDELMRLELIAMVRVKLQRSKKLLHLVSNQGNASFLESVGNNLNHAGNLSTGELTHYVLQIFDQLKNQHGPVSEILNKGVESKKSGNPMSSVVADCVNELITVIPKMLNQKVA